MLNYVKQIIFTFTNTIKTFLINNFVKIGINKMANIKIKLLSSFFLLHCSAFAQTDTLKLNLKDAEKLFLERNFSLIAQKYNVEASKALTKQAKLWDNPELSTEQTLWDESGKFFQHTDSTGQIGVKVEQIFKTAGKRGKQIKLAKDNEQIQQAAFDDLMRNLKYNISLDFYQLNNLIEQRKILENQIGASTNLLKIMEAQYQAGNISLKESIRLQALLFSLKSDEREINNKVAELQASLQTSLGLDRLAFVVPSDIQTAPPTLNLDLNDLFEKAKVSRADYLSEKWQVQSAQHDLSLQKALAIPDISVSVFYDQRNSYTPNFWGLGIDLPLPFFNRNQGNIKAAKLNIQTEQAQMNGLELQMKSEIARALQEYKQASEFNTNIQQNFYTKHDELFANMIKSYKEHQISLIEFLDFFDSYKEVKLKILDHQYNLYSAIAQINYATGAAIIQ